MSTSSVIGVDLGGTKGIIARFTGPHFEREAEERVPTRAESGFSAVIDDMIEGIERLRTPDVKAVGIGVPGLVQQPEGILLQAPNIPDSKNIPLKSLLEERLRLPVFLDNDANCFALAEAIHGSGKGKRIVIGITFGTGVGGGIVIDEKIFQGSHGYAAEIGHMLLMPGSPPYETEDKRGEVEQVLSGTAMGHRCPAAETPEEYLEGAVCSFMQPAIYREVAWLCTNLTYLLDPDVIVFGGSAGHALGSHVDKIIEELKKWTLKGTPLPEIKVATVKGAGALGAALLTRS